MAKQTVKDYWTDRITGHFDRQIEEVSSKEPDLQSRVAKEARQNAIEALGLADLHAEEAKLLAEMDKVKAKADKVRLATFAKVKGIPTPQTATGLGWHWDQEADDAISRRQKVEEEALLAKNPVGKDITTLKEQKRQFLDKLWLTTTAKQITELWSEIEQVK